MRDNNTLFPFYVLCMSEIERAVWKRTQCTQKKQHTGFNEQEWTHKRCTIKYMHSNIYIKPNRSTCQNIETCFIPALFLPACCCCYYYYYCCWCPVAINLKLIYHSHTDRSFYIHYTHTLYFIQYTHKDYAKF